MTPPVHPPSVDVAAAVPSIDGALTVEGIAGPVTIHRDRWGIPHVEASSIPDLFFGQGFATAADRLWQLEHDRRRAEGRLAELLGPGPAIATDLFHRRVRVTDAAQRGYAVLDAETRGVLDAHAAGVNAFVATAAALPVELQALDASFEPWQPWHGVAVFLARHVSFATWQAKLWRARLAARLGPEAVLRWRSEGPPEGATVLIAPPGEQVSLAGLTVAELEPAMAAVTALDWSQHLPPTDGPVDDDAPGSEFDDAGADGSNAWVIAGWRTASGAPILAGDPHRSFETPNVYYQLGLRGAGIDAAGFSFPGVPGILHFGQTASVAWGVTNAMAEYQDLFVEQFRLAADGSPLHRTAAGWEPSDVRLDTVHVRDAPSVPVRSVVTGHGPVVLGDPASGAAVALASTGLQEPGGSLRCILPLLRASDARDLEAAVAGWVEPLNSFLLADRGGSIRYRVGGRLPVRPPAGAWLPVPGWTGEHDWRGVVADADLPRLHDPDGGAIVTANNRVASPGHTVTVGVSPAGPHRAARIWHLLGDRRGLTVDDQAAIHNDAVSLPLLAFARRLEQVDAGLLTSEDVRALLDAVHGWDGTMSTDSVAACIVATVRDELVRSYAGHPALADLSADRYRADEPPATVIPTSLGISAAVYGLVLHGDPWLAPQPGDLDVHLARALDAAAATLRAELGEDPARWTWGSRHRTTFAHPLRRGSRELGALLAPPARGVAGDRDCVRSTSSYPGTSLDAIHGAVARYVWDLADRSASRWIVPLGASGHPGSPHHSDQHDAWVAGELVPVLTDPATVAAEAIATLTLSPEGADPGPAP